MVFFSEPTIAMQRPGSFESSPGPTVAVEDDAAAIDRSAFKWCPPADRPVGMRGFLTTGPGVSHSTRAGFLFRSRGRSASYPESAISENAIYGPVARDVFRLDLPPRDALQGT